MLQDYTDNHQAFINSCFYNLTLFALIFGVMFYDIIGAFGFSYVDEICALLLLLLYSYKVFVSKTWNFDRIFLTVIGVFLFYLVYSIAISSNTYGAIVTDFIIQLKPYLSFFCVYALRPVFSDNQKTIIRQVVVLCSFFVFIVGIAALINKGTLVYSFGHQSRLATASSILALLYLYCSRYTKKDILVFVLILAIGLMSTRSKHIGFFVIGTLLTFYFNRAIKLKLNFKNVFFIVAALALTLLATWEKIYFYFVTGGFGTGRAADDMYARVALYYFASIILMDYIPFGSGFASYATYTSGESYSTIYAKYGMENMYGLTKYHPAFISDTYYPVLAQFGFAGIVLFFCFWFTLFKRAVGNYAKGFYKESVIAILIILFFIIECTSDSTLTHNRGMFMMMLLGLSFADVKRSFKI